MWLHNPCCPGADQKGETLIWLDNPYLLGVPTQEKNQCGYMTAAFSGFPKWAKNNMPTKPLPSPPPHTVDKITQLHPICLLRVPVVGRNPSCYITLAFLRLRLCAENNIAT